MKKILKKFIPSFLLDWYHQLLPLVGTILYGFPSKEIKVIGVTGTNGKTTVVNLITKIFEEKGFRVASISSIKFKIGDKEQPNTLKMTMPGRLKIQSFLRRAVNSGCRYAILEVTSEGIKQYRHRFIDFDVAVFTNLTPEHIEAHHGFENYRKAKLDLFRKTKKIHIVNLNDENAEYFLKFPAEKKYVYGIDGKLGIENWKFVKAVKVNTSSDGISFIVDDILFRLNLLGGFNVYNALAAICVGLSQGIDPETSNKALEKINKIPGRMEVIISRPFKVIVDYAHTPDALQKVYETLSGNSKFQIPNSKMICVLGACGGGRDRWKRPELGKIAAQYCDRIILTNEDPYDENPNQILSQIKSGIFNFQKAAGGWRPISDLYEILDRREAVKKALQLAKPNDSVIIIGKGSELWMCLAKGKKIPWDDRQVVREEFKKINL